MIKVRIRTNALVARIAAFVLGSKTCAIVFRKTIYLHRISEAALRADTGLLCHELTHVMQWKRHGTIGFLVLYLGYSIRYGYYRNPLEIEAREKENDVSILEKVIILEDYPY